MAVVLHYLSGSPYAWRVWLALEHKGIPYTLKAMSYDAGDFSSAEFGALNPRRRVPVLVDGDFVLYESAAIVEYLEDREPRGPHLFSTDVRDRAVQRRMVREADQYFATALEELVEAVLFTPEDRRSEERIAAANEAIRRELRIWETMIKADYLAGALTAVDFTLFPEVALVQRIGRRNPGLVPGDMIGEKMGAWMRRMEALPLVEKTWPPHWRGAAA
ncbi:MAG TPA: glutathione S-transferase family protein [Beijerinckiaceae bacterium]|jgi:glutathione S-transferase